MQVLREMITGGVAPILLKGADFRMRLYGNPVARPMCDLDLLISPEELPWAQEILEGGASQISPPPTETVVINLRRLVSGESPDLNIMVANGDVVHVPFADTAYVMGSVKQQKSVAVKENLTVSQAVAIAGGIDPMLGTNNITIMRFDEQGKAIRINTNLSSIIAKNNDDLPVKNNDVVVVNESSIKKAFYLIKNLLPISGGYSMAAC